MTVDLSTLKAGDTVVLRCGGRVVIKCCEERNVHDGVFVVQIVFEENAVGQYKEDGSYSHLKSPFDIIAIEPTQSEIDRIVQEYIDKAGNYSEEKNQIFSSFLKQLAAAIIREARK